MYFLSFFYQVCVKKCPEETWTWTTLKLNEDTFGFNQEGRKKLICKDYPGITKIDPLTTHKVYLITLWIL